MDISIGWPQAVYLILTLIGLGIVFAKHGETPSPTNAWVTTISTTIILGVLYWGGFFS